MKRITVGLAVSIFVLGTLIADSSGAPRGRRGQTNRGGGYVAGRTERSTNLMGDNSPRVNSTLGQRRSQTVPDRSTQTNTGRGRGSTLGQARRTGAILRDVLPQAISEGARIVQGIRQRRAGMLNDDNGSQAKPLRGRLRENGPLFRRRRLAPNDSELLFRMPEFSENTGTYDGRDTITATYPASLESSPPQPDPNTYNPPPPYDPNNPPPPNDPNFYIAEQLGRMDWLLLHDYCDSHERNLEKLKNQAADIQRMLPKNRSITTEDIDKLENKMLLSLVHYYASDYAKLKKIEEESVEFKDFARMKIAERRAEIQESLEKLGQLMDGFRRSINAKEGNGVHERKW